MSDYGRASRPVNRNVRPLGDPAPLEPVGYMGALLTDEARRAVADEHRNCFRALDALLRHHATEGRASLVERIARALAYADHDQGDHPNWRDYEDSAEVVVLALIGPRAR